MEKIGQTLKLLRESLNLSQREVANGVMDFSYYSRVENDKVNITFYKLTNLLKKMDISMEEFLFMNQQSWKGDNENLRKLVSKAYYSEKTEELAELMPVCAKKYDETGQWNDRYIYILCIYLYTRKKGGNLDQKYINEILERLNSLSYFTKVDVLALSEFYEVLPPEMVFYLFEKMFLEKKRHSAFEKNETNILLFYFNMIDLAFKQEKYNMTQKIFELAKKEFDSPLDLLAKTLFTYYDGIFIILSGVNPDKGIGLAEDAIKIFEICNLNHPAKLHRDNLEHMKNKNIPQNIRASFYREEK